MKNIQAFLVIGALLFVATPVANAEEVNNPNAASQSKCAHLTSNREKVRCIYNNRRTRRYDLRTRTRQNSADITSVNREHFQQQTDRWNKSRAVLRKDCKTSSGLSASTSRKALQRCIQLRKSKVDDHVENTSEMQRGIRRSERNSIRDYGTTRRTFRENARNQQSGRKAAFKRRGMFEFNRDLYNPDLGTMEDELEDDDE